MAQEMNKAELLARAKSEHQRFQDLLAGVCAKEMAGVHGLWSVKDVMTHVAAWQEFMVRWVDQIMSGAPAFAEWADIGVFNERIYQERKDWTLDQAASALDRSYEQSLACVEAIPEERLLALTSFPWGEGPLWHLVAANTFWHYPEHGRAIQIWLDNQSAEPLTYYACPGSMTNPRRFTRLFNNLPAGVDALVKVVQGIMLHIFWAQRYGVTLSEERRAEVQFRSLVPQLARITELDGRPLTEARAPEMKLVGNCRDFSTMLCAMLRYQGVPARARCGFGTYFTPGRYEDHWVCEYWHADQGRWVLVDAQLDDLQRQVLSISFDPLDVPRDQFIVAGMGWQMCRAGQADPDHFGIFDWHGLDFVRGNVVRDFLSLNKVEILPWDFGFGILAEGTDPDLALIDRLAVLTQAGNAAFGELRALYQADDRFHVPEAWINR